MTTNTLELDKRWKMKNWHSKSFNSEEKNYSEWLCWVMNSVGGRKNKLFASKNYLLISDLQKAEKNPILHIKRGRRYISKYTTFIEKLKILFDFLVMFTFFIPFAANTDERIYQNMAFLKSKLFLKIL